MLHNPQIAEKASFNLVIVGNPGSGKTSLVKRYSEDEYQDNPYSRFKYPTTDYQAQKNIDGYDINLNITVTDSIDNALSDKSCYDAILLACDLTDLFSFKILTDNINAILRREKKNQFIVFVGTKNDAENKSINLSERIDIKFLFPNSFATITNVSAKTNENVIEAFESIIRKLIDNQKQIFNTLLDQYNAFTRWDIKYLPTFLQSKSSKDQISTKLKIHPNDEQYNNKIKILAHLFAFKYYRQGDTEDTSKQKDLLIEINKLLKQTPGLRLNMQDLMAYVKNDGYFVQRKIPRHLKNDLASLLDSPTNTHYFQLSLNGICDFNTELKGKMEEFFCDNVGDLNQHDKKVNDYSQLQSI